jgi:ornithine carbamoyltransferase
LSAPAEPKDFATVGDWPREALERILARAHELKRARARGELVRTLEGRSVLLYFEKPSLRTQVTFEVGIGDLGATSVYLHPDQVRIRAGATRWWRGPSRTT